MASQPPAWSASWRPPGATRTGWFAWCASAGLQARREAPSRHLEARLAALPDHLQVCLRLRLTGLNSREIADQLGVSRGCVLYRLSQALKSLGVESTNFFSDF